jgi:hypothetical protein
MATLINMTNLVEERGTIQDAAYVQDCATANGAFLRHGEHRDFPFAKEEIKCVSVPPHLQRLRVFGFTTIDKSAPTASPSRAATMARRPIERLLVPSTCPLACTASFIVLDRLTTRLEQQHE